VSTLKRQEKIKEKKKRYYHDKKIYGKTKGRGTAKDGYMGQADMEAL
jgi:hypothetical protein